MRNSQQLDYNCNSEGNGVIVLTRIVLVSGNFNEAIVEGQVVTYAVLPTLQIENVKH